MRCPSCSAENPPTATSCLACQVTITPRRRRRSDPVVDSPQTEIYNVQIRKIFQLCLWSAIPLVGLILGPIGARRAYRFWQESSSDPAFQAGSAARVALYLGTLTGVTNWLGLVLILLGWCLS